MAFEFSPHAPVDIDRPEAWKICDRCGFRFLASKTSFQWDFRGNQLQNLHIIVCDPCYDTPQDQLRPIIIGPDPVPVKDPRPGWYAQQNQGGFAVPGSGASAFGYLQAGPGDPLIIGPGQVILD